MIIDLHEEVYNIILHIWFLLFVRYESCSWGWSDSKKLEELNDEAAWYLIAKSMDTGTWLGFSHFRFDMDEGIEVLYW